LNEELLLKGVAVAPFIAGNVDEIELVELVLNVELGLTDIEVETGLAVVESLLAASDCE